MSGASASDERLERVLAAWDPDEGDLPEELALALGNDDRLSEQFDQRFPRSVGPEVARRDRRNARAVGFVAMAVAASFLLTTLIGATPLRGIPDSPSDRNAEHDPEMVAAGWDNPHALLTWGFPKF